MMGPVNDAVVPGDSVVFTWRGTGSGTEYTFTVTGTTGRIVLERSTVDTTLVVPVVPALTRGSTYFWYVDAVLINGEPATTGTHRFLISP